MISSRPPNSALNYPAIQRAAAGRGADIREDAIGRRMVANPMRSPRSDNYLPSGGGFSRPKGMETYIEDILAAGRQGFEQHMDRARRQLDNRVSGITAAFPTRAPTAQPTQAPGGIGNLSEQDYAMYLPETGGRRPPSARLQALAMQRKNGGSY